MEHYGWTQHYTLWEITMPQFLHWYRVAVEIQNNDLSGVLDDKEAEDVREEIKDTFIWDDEKGKYVIKNG